MGIGELAGHADRPIGPVIRARVNDIGAVSLEDLLSLSGNVLGHAERNRESFSSTDHRVRNAGIAACSIQQDLPRCELPLPTAFGDNVRGRSILNGSPRVVPFGLTQK